jgi:hypothetical protein
LSEVGRPSDPPHGSAVHVAEGVGDLDVEDGGQALIVHVDAGDDVDEGWFVRVQSWSERKQHEPWVAALHGKRVRVTVEVLDEETS